MARSPIDPKVSRACHSLYIAVYHSHHQLSDIFTAQECRRILCAVMAAKSFSWRVVGITPTALAHYSKQDFKHMPHQKLTRAHLTPMIQTVRNCLERESPFSEGQFMDHWLKNDDTVICAAGENKKSVPNYIPIDNEDGKLFSCENKVAGWYHNQAEISALRSLFLKVGN